MAIYDVRVNGVSLMTMAYGVDVFDGRRVVPQRRVSAATIPGVQGQSLYYGEFEPAHFKIGLWVKAALPGAAPTAAGLEANLDTVLKLFTQRGPVTVSWEGPNSKWRTAHARVVSEITPEIDYGALSARVEVLFENPDSFWIGESYTFTTTTMGSFVPITNAASMTGVDAKSTVRLYGPATNPSITIGDFVCSYTGVVPSGGWIEYNSAALRAEDHLNQGIGPKVSQTKPVFFNIEPGSQVLVQGAGAGARLEIRGRTMYT